MFRNLASRVFKGGCFEIDHVGNGNQQMAKATNQGFFFFFSREWFISTSLLARQDHSDFNKTSGLCEQRGFIKGFVVVQTDANSGKHEYDF